MKKIYLLPIVCFLVIISCQKEEIVIPYNCTANMIDDETSQNTTNNTINLNGSNPQITGVNGTNITFSSSSFLDANGVVYNGNVNIEIIETQDNKDMLLMDCPTITNTGDLLVSGGIIFLNATDEDGNLLSITPDVNNQPIVSVPNSTNNTNDMFLYTDGELDGNFVWVENSTTPIQLINGTYDFPVSSSGGVNLDYPVPTCTGNITIDLPSKYNGSNTSVMIYFTDRNSSITAYDVEEDGNFVLSNIFCSGDSVQFVVISQVEGIRRYHVTDIIEIPSNTWQISITNDDMKIALCDDALRLLIKEDLE